MVIGRETHALTMNNRKIKLISVNFLIADIILLLILVSLTRCSHEQRTDSYLQSDTEEYIEDIIIEDADVEEDTYALDCYRTQYWFCPPLDAIWQMPVIVDICIDPPQVIEVGECEEYFECDPSVFEQGENDCTTENGFPGAQKIYCNKGHYEYGECVTPCTEEICDYKDNDCDGQIDESQTNACGVCGLVPSEACDNLDNDCDGLVDEDLIQECFTSCGSGVEYCISGNWISCTAPAVEKEICNNLDDNCNGLVDEDLDCGCTEDMVGILIPCAEEPLLCGQGFKSCECKTPECIEFITSPCQAACSYYPSLNPNCDPLVGMEMEVEACNKFDDDCDELIDEALVAGCYTGPDGTSGIGICLPGEIICEEGVWGNYLEESFQPGFCDGEVLPEDSDNCNGTDDDCDGLVDDGKELKDTDILFLVDWSGSMSEEIEAVKQALTMFASNYSDEEVIQWGMAVGPITKFGGVEELVILTNFTDFQTFVTTLATDAPSLSGGREMLYDALYLSLFSIATPATPPDKDLLLWENKVNSSPVLSSFAFSWREDANRVVIVFTDEEGQSYLDPSIKQTDLIATTQAVEDLNVYAFTNNSSKENGFLENGWAPVAVATGGEWFELTPDPGVMYTHLLEILDENICE